MTTDPTPLASDAITYHDGLARGWDDRYARGGFRKRAEFFQSKILPHLDCRGSWIDVGCGSGYFTRLLAARGAEVLGVDGSAAMIAAARDNASGTALPVTPRFEVATVEAMDVSGKTFQGVLCLSVLEYVDDASRCFSQLAGMVAADGYLVMSVPNRMSLVRRLQRLARAVTGRSRRGALDYLGSSRQTWSNQELRRLINANGLTCQDIRGFDPLLPRWLWKIVPPSLFFVIARKPARPV